MLTDAELRELTGYVRMADQRKLLQSRGWRFEVSSNGTRSAEINPNRDDLKRKTTSSLSSIP